MGLTTTTLLLTPFSARSPLFALLIPLLGRIKSVDNFGVTLLSHLYTHTHIQLNSDTDPITAAAMDRKQHRKIKQ